MFEYLVEELGSQEWLNEKAAEGWELVCINKEWRHDQECDIAYFKRSVQSCDRTHPQC
ncbi:MAG TPA: hypothetical protein V6D06_12035 [Trichocoleus sp.]